jgi:hypothetical protein
MDQRLPSTEKQQLVRALNEVEKREGLRMRADNGDQQAIRLLERIRERKRPLEQYPDPGEPVIEEVIEQPARRQRMLTGATGSQPALTDVRMQFELEDVPVRGPITVSEERRKFLMDEMRQNVKAVDPSRERTTGNDTDYRMENGLILRLHQSPTVMWLEILQPTESASRWSTSLGIVARLQNWRGASETAIQRRIGVYEIAKSLQPKTIEELAAINKTAEMPLSDPSSAAASSGPTTLDLSARRFK